MPELPEVEITKRKLEPLLVGRRLYQAIRYIVSKSIRLGGTTMRDWLHPDRSEGRYWQARLAYQRAGEKCRRCGGIIKRIKVASRGTFICEKCQKL